MGIRKGYNIPRKIQTQIYGKPKKKKKNSNKVIGGPVVYVRNADEYWN